MHELACLRTIRTAKDVAGNAISWLCVCFFASQNATHQYTGCRRWTRATPSAIGVSRPPVLDCGTTFHPDYGGRDLPSTPSDNLQKLIYLPTEALSDSFEFIRAIEIRLSICLSIYLSIVLQTEVGDQFDKGGAGLRRNQVDVRRAGFKCVEALGRIIIRGPYPPSNAIIYMHLQL